MNDQDISAPEAPANDTGVTDTPAGAASGESAKPKRPSRRKAPPTVADGDTGAAPVRRNRKTATPVDGALAPAEIEAGEVVTAASTTKKVPARKRAPRKAKAAEASPPAVPLEAPPAEEAQAGDQPTPDVLPEATEMAGPVAAIDEVPAQSVVETAEVAVTEAMAIPQAASESDGLVEAQSDQEADVEADTAGAPGDSPARRKRRRKKRKAHGADEAASGQPVDLSSVPAVPEVVSRQADLPFAPEAVTETEPLAVPRTAGRVELIGLDPGCGLAERDRECLLGSEHVLADATLVAQLALPEGRVVETLPGSVAALRQRLEALADKQVAVVVAGDPVCEGPGRALLAEFGPGRIALRPAVGRVQAALARVGLALDDAVRVDLAAVGMAGLVARLRGGRLYAVTLDAQTRPQDVGHRLEAAGFHQARVWLVEPGAEGAVHALLGFELSDSRIDFATGSVLAIYTALGDGSLNDWPGLSAALLRADALPEALRLLALAWLQPTAEETGWAIEPGEAALAIDWSRHRPAADVFAIGSEPAQLASVRLRFGAGEGLQAVVSGSHRSLSELPDPDLVFIRASEELGQQIRTAWERLRPGGRMVVVAEDEQARVDLMHFANRSPAQRWQEVSVAEGGSHAGRPRLEPARAARIMLWKKPVRG